VADASIEADSIENNQRAILSSSTESIATGTRKLRVRQASNLRKELEKRLLQRLFEDFVVMLRLRIYYRGCKANLFNIQ